MKHPQAVEIAKLLEVPERAVQRCTESSGAIDFSESIEATITMDKLEALSRLLRTKDINFEFAPGAPASVVILWKNEGSLTFGNV